MKFTKKGFVFGTLIISSIIIGGYIGQHTDSSLLSNTVSIGLNHEAPLSINLMIMTISLGFTLDISIAQVICIITAIVIYTIFSRFID